MPTRKKTPTRITATRGRPTAGAAKGGVSKKVKQRKGRPAVGEDRGLGKILVSRSTDRIVPEVARRLETGRQHRVGESLKAAEAELALLRAEAARIEEEGDPGGGKAARVAQFLGAVEADVEIARMTVRAVQRRVAPEKDGWSVMGRVVGRDGLAPKKARVVFVDEQGAQVKTLASIPIDSDGLVRKSYSLKVVTRLAAAGTRVAAAVRIGTQIVATDTTRTKVRARRLHQFDLRTP